MYIYRWYAIYLPLVLRHSPMVLRKPWQAEILRLLLNAGAMSEARDHNGCTAGG